MLLRELKRSEHTIGLVVIHIRSPLYDLRQAERIHRQFDTLLHDVPACRIKSELISPANSLLGYKLVLASKTRIIRDHRDDTHI